MMFLSVAVISLWPNAPFYMNPRGKTKGAHILKAKRIWCHSRVGRTQRVYQNNRVGRCQPCGTEVVRISYVHLELPPTTGGSSAGTQFFLEGHCLLRARGSRCRCEVGADKGVLMWCGCHFVHFLWCYVYRRPRTTTTTMVILQAECSAKFDSVMLHEAHFKRRRR